MAPQSDAGSRVGTSAGARPRSNTEWLAALQGGGDEQAAALSDLRAYLLRTALFTLQRALHYIGHLESSAVGQIAEECAQEALTAIVQGLHEFRGDSKFTTWTYAFAVNMALTAARRECWGHIDLDRILDGGSDALTSPARDEDDSPDPERRALQAEMMVAIRDGIERHLTPRQRQALMALVFEDVPLDEIVRRWGSNRNAVYKLVHDARRKLKAHLEGRGFDLRDAFDLFAVSR
jgi:RNA polymerase sigma-70 factor (ECF subfamily)